MLKNNTSLNCRKSDLLQPIHMLTTFAVCDKLFACQAFLSLSFGSKRKAESNTEWNDISKISLLG